MKRIFYRAVFNQPGFSNAEFQFLRQAREFKKSHQRGLPHLTQLTQENRKYWRKIGGGIRLYKVIETLTRIKKLAGERG